jgi:cytochrome c oxidase cbb3-type subunit 3
MSDSHKSGPKTGDYAREKGEVVLRPHEFDGIQEYDQKLPNWWLFTFYGAVVFTVIYWTVYYHTNLLKTDHELVQEALVVVEKARQDELEKALATIDDTKLVTVWAADSSIVAAGQSTYTTNCSNCHGPDLSATMEASGKQYPLPGLPLTDHQWKYGGKPMDLFKLINAGTPPESAGHNGARMQPWGQTLSPKQIAEVTAFIIAKVPDDFKAYAAPGTN